MQADFIARNQWHTVCGWFTKVSVNWHVHATVLKHCQANAWLIFTNIL